MSKGSSYSKMNKKDMVKTGIIAFIPALLMMCAIFYFSSCDADESSKSSGLIVNIILGIFKGLGIYNADGSSDKVIDILTVIVRKGAHMTEYGVLFGTFYHFCKSIMVKHVYLISYVCTVLYAASDEIHQLYVPGRAGRATDVLIDGCGALIALIIIRLVIKRGAEKKNTKEISAR